MIEWLQPITVGKFSASLLVVPLASYRQVALEHLLWCSAKVGCRRMWLFELVVVFGDPALDFAFEFSQQHVMASIGP
jgi:hypothetical protein